MGHTNKFCFVCAPRPVNTCCCGCSLFCATITLCGAINILVSAILIAVYRNLEYSDTGYNYYTDSSNIDKIKGKLIAIYSLELVYSILLLYAGITGTMSQSANPHNARRYYYSYLLFVVVYELFYIAIIIIYGSMFNDITDNGYYDRRVSASQGIISGIINVIITTLIQTYFLLVVWSNWQKKKHGIQNFNRVRGADLVIIQQAQPIQMQQMQNQSFQPYQNYQPQTFQPYQPQVQMYQPQVQMMTNNQQPQIQEAVVYQNDFGGAANVQQGIKQQYF